MAEKISKKYLSLKEAAEMFGYAPDYIGSLIRDGKIRGKKTYSGISWQLTPQEILEYCSYCSAEKEIRFIQNPDNPLLKKHFLSLQEAAEISGYSKDYLGQLLRREIIKGKKIYTQTFWLVNGDDLKRYSAHGGQAGKESTPKNAEKNIKSPVFNLLVFKKILLDSVKQRPISKRTLTWGVRAGFAALMIFSFFSGLVPTKFLQSSLGAIFIGDTKIINFYPSFSGGDWQNSQNVLGQPDINEESNINSFTEFNSAVYQTGPLSILIGDFESTEPLDTVLTPGVSEETLVVEEPLCENGANRPCSSDIGECQIGVQVCSNGVWEACLGAVMPRDEICDAVDNDCNGEIDDGENTCPHGPYQLETIEPEIFLLQKAKNLFGLSARAQGRNFSAKIKFSFAMGEKEPDVIITPGVDGKTPGVDEPVDDAESSGFWQGIKNFFSDLFDKKTHLAEAQENFQNENETTSDEIIDVERPLIFEEPGVSGDPTSANLDKDKEEKDLEAPEATTSEDILEPAQSPDDIEAGPPQSEGLGRELGGHPTSATSTEEDISGNQRNNQHESASTIDIDAENEDNFNVVTSTDLEASVLDLDARIIVFWSLDGEVWRQLGVISEYPTSNNLNGGYFEFNAPFLNNFDDIKNLKIKFEGLVGGETNVMAYLDSAWVEVKYEKEKKQEKKEKGREGEFELLSERKDFQLQEDPEFKFHYQKKEKNNLLASVGEFLGLVDEWRDVDISAESEFPTEVILGDDGEFSVKIEKPRDFKPGVYKLIVEVGSEEFVQEFTWGVLAINVNKSIYLPAETAYIQMADLRDDGHTICDANLQLEITPPNGSSTPINVERSGRCGANNITDVPDYFAHYQVSDVGIYQMKLTDLNTGYQIIDFFEVRESVPFDVERIGPTRIYPPASYEMTLKIKVNKDFNGQVIETVPFSFDIKSQFPNDNFQTISNDSISKQLVWNVDWKKGESYEFKYEFDAPDVSPYLYLLGPLSLTTLAEVRPLQTLIDRVLGFVNPTYENGSRMFEEARRWQVAADSPANRIIEQQINIIDQEYSTTTITAVPTDNRLGLIRWTGGSYGGTSNAVYFETIMKTSNASFAASSTLFTSAGVAVANSSTSTNSTSYVRIRTGDISSSLSSGTDYTVRIASENTAATASIKAARLIIVQSTSTGFITNTETQVEVGNASSSITSTSYVTSTDPKIYLYDADVFTPTPTAYFEVTIMNSGLASSTVFNSTTTGSAGFSWNVPSGVTSITIKAWGAGGGGGGGETAGEDGGAGGGGGFAKGVIAVTPGNTLKVYVGGGGAGGISATHRGGGGGGLTGVFLTTTSTPLVIVGSGGGGGGAGDVNEDGGSGGGGGGYAGTDGTTPSGGGDGGNGGTETGGGTGGNGATTGGDGTNGDNYGRYTGGYGGDVAGTTGGGGAGGTIYGGSGGLGTTANSGGGGGGAAGYYGGGGGEAGPTGTGGEGAGGGGGSSAFILDYSSNSENTSTTGNTQSAGTATEVAAVNTGDSDYLLSAGYSGAGGAEAAGTTGQPGRVVLNYNLPATTTVALYDLAGNEVTGSAVATTSTSWIRARSSAITLADNTQYLVQVKTSDGAAAGGMANAKLILTQSAAVATGIEKLETVSQYLNTSTSTIATASTSVQYYNYYDPANWSGAAYDRYFEATMMAPSSQTIFADLATATDTIANSGIATTSTTYGRQRSSSTLTMPSSATNTDTRVRVSAGTGMVHSSWLIHQIRGLNTPMVDLSSAKTTSDTGNTTVLTSETDQWMGTFGFQRETGSDTMTNIVLTLDGSQVAADLSKIYLYWDDDSTYNSGSEALFASSTSIGITTGFSSSTGVTVSNIIGYIHVVFDIASGATEGNTTGGKIAGNGDITYSGNTTSTGASITTGTGTIQLPPATLTQRAFIFENDDGSTINSNSTFGSANTTSTSIKKGQRIIARFQIDETNGGSTTTNLKIQYNTGWATSGWADVMSSGPPTSNRGASTTDWNATTVDSAGNVGSYTSLAIGADGLPIVAYYDTDNTELNIAKCTQEPCTAASNWSTSSITTVLGGDFGLDNSIALSTSGLPVISSYSLDDGLGSKGLLFSRCNQEPCVDSINWNHIELDSSTANTGRYNSIIMGQDNLPIISYYDIGDTDLNVAICTSWPCNTNGKWSTTSIDGFQGGDVGLYTSIAIATSGLPIISYYDTVNANLNIAIATNTPLNIAANWVTTTVDGYQGGQVGTSTSIAIGTDGLPVVSYYANNSDLNVAKCNQTPCSTQANWSTSSVDSINNVGQYSSIAIGKDGFPIISYQDVTNAAMKMAKCNDIACFGGDETIITVNDLNSAANSGGYSAIAIGKDGWPWVSYFDDDNDDLKVAHMSPLTEIQPAIGLSGINGATLTTNKAGSCAGGTTFQNGAWHEATGNSSSTFTLGANKCTEMSFVIDTREATASTTYRLRLVSSWGSPLGGGYQTYPAFTIASSSDENGSRRYSKEAILTSASNASSSDWNATTVDLTGTVGQRSSLAFGTDGLPIVAYYDATGINLNIAKCTQEPCTTATNWSTTSIDGYQGGNVGNYASIAIGADGLPIVSYYDASRANLNIAKCNQEPCTTAANWSTTTPPDSTGGVGEYSSIAISRDGLPIVSYYDGNNSDLKIAKCTAEPCTTAANWSAVTVESANIAGPDANPIAIMPNGLPIVAYRWQNFVASPTLHELRIAQCTLEPCTTATNWSTTSIDGYQGGNVGLYASIAIDRDGLPIISYYDTDNTNLNIAKCTQEPCATATNWSTTTVDSAGIVGQFTSITIGKDGLPLVSYQNVTDATLMIAKCNAEPCTTASNWTTSTINFSGSTTNVGGTSIAIGKDGYPWISYFYEGNNDLKVAKQLGLPTMAIGYYNRTTHSDQKAKVTRMQWTGNSTSSMIIEHSPMIEDGLAYWFDGADYSAVTTNDIATSTITSVGTSDSTTTPLFYFAEKHTTSTQPLYARWIGQSSVAAGTKNIKLEVFRFGNTSTTSKWYTLATESSCTAETDCDIQGSTTTDLNEFFYPEYNFDESRGTILGTSTYPTYGTTTLAEYWTFWRVYQDPAINGQNLETDYWKVQSSAFSTALTVSGTVYTDEGGTTMASGRTVTLAVNGVSAGSDATDGSGVYSITNVTINNVDDVLTAFLDGTDEKAATVSNASSTSINIDDLHLYQNRVIVRDQGSPATALTNTDMDQYDSGNNGNIPFTVSGTSLTVSSTAKLYIWPNKTFNPGGTITMLGDALASPFGDLHISNGATLTAGGNISVSGNWIASSTATFTAGSNTVTMTATTTGKEIWTASATGTDFYNLTFDGSGGTGGAWTFKTDATTTNNFTITDGTVTAPANLYVGNNYSNSSTFTNNSGTVWMTAYDGSNTVTPGNSNFYNLTFATSSDGSTGAWSFADSATTTNDFTITAGTVTAPTNLYITGSYLNSDTFTHNSGKITFNSTGAETITAGGVTSDFFQLEFDGSGGQWTFVGAATSTATTTITQGTVIQAAAANLDLASFTIGASGIFTAASGVGVIYFEDDDPIFIADNRASKTTLGNIYIGYSPATTNQSSDLVVSSLTVNSGDTHNTRGYEIDSSGAITVNGTGTLNANSSAAGETNGTIINVGTDWTVAAGATFTAEEPGSASTTVIFDENTASTITPGGTDEAHDFWNFTVQKSGAVTATLAGAIDIENDVEILGSNSTFDVSTSNYQINVGGSWATTTGTFNARNGTVVFDSTALTETITPGNSAFASTTFDGSGGGWTIFGSSVTTTNNLTIRSGNVTSTTGILYIGGNSTTSNSAFFGHNSGTVQLYGVTSTALNSGCSDADACGNDFYSLIINKTAAGNDTVTTTNHLRVANTLTLTDGEFYQGSSGETYDVRIDGNATAASVAAAGTWTNHGRGDLILGGDVSNLGTIDFKTDNQTCSSPSQSDDIYIHSTTTPNTTDWSGGGTNTMFHVKVKDQTATGITITVNGGTDDGGNDSDWVFANCGVTISGTLYSNEGTTQITSGGQFIAMRVNGVSYYTTTTYSGTGAWHIDGVSGLFGSVPIIVYVTTTDNSVYAANITKASSTDAFTGLDLYQNRVAVKHEATSGTSTDNTELGLWDRDDDSQIQFSVSGTSLTVATTSKLYIWPNKTFAPGGTIATAGDGANWVYPGGDLQIAEGATLTAGGAISVSGSWIASSTATYTPGGNTVTMTATTTGKEIWTPTSTAGKFYNLTFDGSGGTGGAWTFQNGATTTNNFTINDGTVTLPASNLYVGGNFFADDNPATFINNSGTVLFNATNTGKTVDDGGSNFYNITFNGVGGAWLYQDGTSTAPNLMTVQNGTTTMLNAKTGASPSVTGGELIVDWYLGVNLVDATNTAQNIDTDTCKDITISENTASSTVFSYINGAWSSGFNSTTTGTGTACGGPSAGINPQPGTTGAVRIREYDRTANGTSTYKYNMQVAWQNNWGAYNWSTDYGEDNYLFSSSTNGNYNVVGERWHRTSSTTINSAYACAAGSGDTCLNQAPTNGSWYAGLITGLIFSIPSGFSADFGTLDSTNNWTASATTTLNVKTSAANGYSITAWALNNGRMQLEDLGIYIAKWSGTNDSPTEWDTDCPNGSSYCGFGYTSDDSTLGSANPDRFTNNADCGAGAGKKCWAGFAILGAGDPVGDFGSPTTTATTTIAYRVSVNSAQAAGNYQTTIIYIATPNY